MKFTNLLNKRFEAGLTTELYLASFYSSKNYEVFWPLKTQSKCDFLIFKSSEYYKVQAKTATWSKIGNYRYLQCRISTRNKNSKPNYKKEDCDLIVVRDRNRIWEIPFEEIQNLTSLCLDSDNPKYKPQTKYNPKKWLVQEHTK